jgi:hypothetical protein
MDMWEPEAMGHTRTPQIASGVSLATGVPVVASLVGGESQLGIRPIQDRAYNPFKLLRRQWAVHQVNELGACHAEVFADAIYSSESFVISCDESLQNPEPSQRRFAEHFRRAFRQLVV